MLLVVTVASALCGDTRQDGWLDISDWHHNCFVNKYNFIIKFFRYLRQWKIELEKNRINR